MSESVVNFRRGAAWRLPRVVSPARNALVRSVPTLKFLYRACAMVSAYGFVCVWLWFLGGDRNFATVVTHCDADLRAVGLMASIALVHAVNFAARMLSDWPPALGVPAAVLLVSFVIYGAVTFARNARA